MPDERDDFDIRHVAALARLELTPAEESLYARQLAEILAFARRVLHVDTSQHDGDATRPAAIGVPLRDDTARASLTPEQTLDQAPTDGRQNGLFRVPRVIG